MEARDDRPIEQALLLQRLGQHLEAHQRLMRNAQLRALREIHLPADDNDGEHGQRGWRTGRCPPGDRDGEEDHDGNGRQQESCERPVRPRQVHEVDAGVDRDERDQRKEPDVNSGHGLERAEHEPHERQRRHRLPEPQAVALRVVGDMGGREQRGCWAIAS